MSTKIKPKYSYGGYKIAQNGLDTERNQYGDIQPLTPRPYVPYQPQNIVPIEQIPVQPQQVETQPSTGFVDRAIGAVETGANLYQSFIESKRKLANQVNNGIAVAAGVANLFDEAQLRREENERRIQSLQSQTSQNSNRGLNNIPIYTKYGGSSKANVEAEQGEVFTNNGDVLKISDSANTHEEGGVPIVADKVLENTSSMRKDPISQSLKLSKEDVTLMSGFEAKRGMSHSDAYEFEAKKNAELQDKFLKAISKVVSNPVADKYGIESANLNTNLGLAQLPSENEIFDKYFDHQEQVKTNQGFYDNKLQAKYGKAQDGYYNPYTKGKQKTPTGKSSNFPADKSSKQYINNWNQTLGKNYGIDDVYPLQYDSYTYALENNPDAVRDMWKTYGLNNKAQQNGVNYDVNNLSNDQLLALREQYTDGLLGTRLLNGFLPAANVTAQRPSLEPRPMSTNPALPLPKIATPPINPDATNAPSIQSPQPTQTKAPEEFNQPLEWYDTIGPTTSILSALRRDPELYNPMNVSQLRLQQQDVRPALENSQAEYNAATSNLSNDSIGAAQRAQIFSNKLRQDNQVIGQYENANRQIQNQETQYNTQARDRQEAANAQSRQNFYDRVLQGRAKQTEQLLTGIDSLAKTFAENRAFNRNANLLMKLAPNFDAKGNYNGVPVQFASNSANQAGFATTNGQPTINSKGQYLLRSRTKDGKVTEEWVDKAYYDQTVKNASSDRIQSQMVMDLLKGGKKK